MHTVAASFLAAQCSVCGTPLAGAMSVVFRAFGIRRSPRNPNLCNRCDTHVEEGRVVEMTVLFADLSSFTELTHDLGPERTHRVVDAFLRMASETLIKHGAFIDKYVGDAVMALFNVPVRYADHGRRAVVAARELQSGLEDLGRGFGLSLRASVGVASGWARVGRLGSTESRDYTAIGEVVNLAARLQGEAGPGEILVGEETYRKHAADFPDAARERISVKGFREPVEAYRLNRSGTPGAVAQPTEVLGREKAGIGAIVFGILGAPCAVTTLIGPLAVAAGAGGLFGLSAALAFLDQSLLRVPILLAATLVALANLYTLWHARKLRAEGKVPAHLKIVTALERRRTVFVLAASLLSLAAVVSEVVAHTVRHGR